MSATEHEHEDAEAGEQPVPPETPPDEDEQADEDEHAVEGGPSEADEQPDDEALSEKDLAKLQDAMAREFKRHTKRVTEITGDAAPFLEVCELCEPDFGGFHWPPASTPARSELHGRLLAVLTTPDGPDYRSAVNANECPECAGLGKVKSGSKVPEQRLIVCTRCNGAGWTKLGGGNANGSQTAAPEPVPVAAGHDAPPSEDADSWGIPRLLEDGQPNPNYGRTPPYWDHAYPVGRIT